MRRVAGTTIAPALAVGLALALALALALGGCGHSAATPSAPPARAPAGLVSAVLGFWRAVGAHHYRDAYDYLGTPLRRSLPYRSFATTAAGARAVFARTPRIARVRGSGQVRTVYVASARGDLARPDAVQVVFTMRRYRSGWQIAAAPITRPQRARRGAPQTRRGRRRRGATVPGRARR